MKICYLQHEAPLNSRMMIHKAYTNQVDPYVDITHMDQLDPYKLYGST